MKLAKQKEEVDVRPKKKPLPEWDFDIDQNALDTECQRHPKMVHDVGVLMAKAKREIAYLERDFETLRADLDSTIRNDPTSYGIEKVTEPAIKAAIATAKELHEAQDAVIEAQYRMNLLIAASRTLDHRKRNISDLIELHGRAYFADVRPSAAGKASVDVARRKKVHGVRRRDVDEDDEDD